MDKKITLKEAQKKDQLEKFIQQEEETSKVGDEKDFNQALKLMLSPNVSKKKKPGTKSD